MCNNEQKAIQSYPPNDGNRRHRGRKWSCPKSDFPNAIAGTNNTTDLITDVAPSSHLGHIYRFIDIDAQTFAHLNVVALPNSNRATGTAKKSTPNCCNKRL